MLKKQKTIWCALIQSLEPLELANAGRNNTSKLHIWQITATKLPINEKITKLNENNKNLKKIYRPF